MKNKFIIIGLLSLNIAIPVYIFIDIVETGLFTPRPFTEYLFAASKYILPVAFITASVLYFRNKKKTVLPTVLIIFSFLINAYLLTTFLLGYFSMKNAEKNFENARIERKAIEDSIQKNMDKISNFINDSIS